MAKKNLLKNLSVDEISLVDAPANQGARVVLLKRDEKGDIMDPNTEDRASLLKRLAQYLGIEEVPGNANEGDDDMADEALTKKVDELTKKLEEATKAAADAKAAQEAAEKKLTEKDEAVKKSDNFRAKLSPALQKTYDDMDEKERAAMMERMSKSEEDPIAKALEAAATLAKNQAERIEKLERNGRIAKIKGDLKDVAAEKIDDVAEAVDALAQKDKDATDVLVKALKAVSAQAKAGNLFKIAGQDGEGASDAASALDAAVTKLRAAEPTLTREAAVAKALAAEPALYDNYLAESKE